MTAAITSGNPDLLVLLLQRLNEPLARYADLDRFTRVNNRWRSCLRKRKPLWATGLA